MIPVIHIALPLPLVLLLVLGISCVFGLAGELTFELPDSEKQCFHEVIDKDVKCTLEFQVITGGNYDVDMELHGPNGEELYKDSRKQYDSFTWTTSVRGEYQFCFSNEFSTFTHKVVYFDFQVGDDAAFGGGDDTEKHHTVLTQMELSATTAHENLKDVLDYQTHHRLRATQGRVFAEDLNERVQYWSIGQACVIVVVSIGQVLVLRSFFTDKRGTVGTT